MATVVGVHLVPEHVLRGDDQIVVFICSNAWAIWSTPQSS